MSPIVALKHEMDVAEQIRTRVAAAVPKLDPDLQAWVQEHLITPRLVDLARDADGKTSVPLWLVTDHVGRQDSSYRVVWDPDALAFGLECTLANGVEWYMGPHKGGFADVIRAL
ncbi:MAG TPA: hypothetical protein VFO67_00015 [Gemmatimonadales bacterium]|nr:hypothetical protein [Gemmatimonadales bacterium]